MSLRIKYWIQKKLPFKFVRKILVRLFHKKIKYFSFVTDNELTGYAYTDKQIKEYNSYCEDGYELKACVYNSKGYRTIKTGEMRAKDGFGEYWSDVEKRERYNVD